MVAPCSTRDAFAVAQGSDSVALYWDFENLHASLVDQASGAGTYHTSRFRPLGEYVVRYFGTPNTGTGDFQGGLHEHLYLNNGPLSQMIGVKGGLAEYLADTKKPVEERVGRLFLTTLNRRPAPEEMKKFAAFLNTKTSPADAVWALITSSEFRFNH